MAILLFLGPSRPEVHYVGKLRGTSDVAVPLNCESDEADKEEGAGEG